MSASGGRSIALYGHRLGPAQRTGVSLYVRELIPALAATGAFDYVLGGSREAAAELPPPSGLPLRRPPVPRRILHASWTAAGRPMVDRWLGHPDLLHVLYPSCPVPSTAPVVYTLHDLMPLTHPEWYAPYERAMFRRAVGDAARRAVAVVAVSRWVADLAQDRLGIDPARLHVVPLGVRPQAAPVDPGDIRRACERYGQRPGGYVVALGAVSTRKNLGVVVEALSRWPGGAAPHLLAVGPAGRGAEETVELARRLGASDRVRFTGWLPADEVAALLAGAVALVHPSRDEGFGVTPLEAMAAGVPTVVSLAGALPEVTGDASVSAPPDDAGAWLNAIRHTVEDQELRRRLVARGRERVRRHTWERAAHLTAEVHRACLDGGQARSSER